MLVKVLRDFKPDHQDFCEPVLKAVDEAVADAKPDPWVGTLLRGTIRICNAWAWRGTGWADSVSNEGQAAMERNFQEAEALLSASWKANPTDPMAAAYSCALSGAGSSSVPMEIWLERSMKACFDYTPAYEVVVNFKLPRWGGSYRELLALGCDFSDTGRFDTDVPWRLITMCAAVIRDADEMKTDGMNVDDKMHDALADPRVVASVDACLDGYRLAHPNQGNRYECLRAAIQWQGRRKEQARLTLSKVAEADLQDAVNRDYHVDLKVIKAWTATR
jgi:hypothetical protein